MKQTLGIIDDDPAVLASLTAVFETIGYDVRAFESAQSFLTSLANVEARASIDCLIVDLRMPEMTGVELQRHLVEGLATKFPIIVITAYGEVRAAVEALKLGAEDFIEKPFEDDALVNAVEAAIKRVRSIRERLQAKEKAERRLASLSPREREILSQVASGSPSKVIAHNLGISRRTVEIHRTNILRKVEASNLAELIGLVYLAGSEPDRR